MKTVLAILLVLVGLVSSGSSPCGSTETGPISAPEGKNHSAVDIPFSRPTFSPPSYCPEFVEPFNKVIRSEEEWRSLFFKYTQWVIVIGVDVPPPPDIDFDNEMLIFMCGGAHSTGGYSLSIRAVTLCDHKLVVGYEGSSPEPGDLLTQAFTWTGDMIKVPRYDLPVEFISAADPL
jgi:hypothetical protein